MKNRCKYCSLLSLFCQLSDAVLRMYHQNYSSDESDTSVEYGTKIPRGNQVNPTLPIIDMALYYGSCIYMYHNKCIIIKYHQSRDKYAYIIMYKITVSARGQCVCSETSSKHLCYFLLPYGHIWLYIMTTSG